MNPSFIPVTCSLALATLSGAALDHWWSLREFAGTFASPAAAPLASAPSMVRRLAAAPLTPPPPATPLSISRRLPHSRCVSGCGGVGDVYL